MNILSFLNRQKNDSANVAKRRLLVAVGKAALDIDSIVADLQSVINKSLAKYSIEKTNIKFKHSQKSSKHKLEVAFDES